jgi:hypothetical protein
MKSVYSSVRSKQQTKMENIIFDKFAYSRFLRYESATKLG